MHEVLRTGLEGIGSEADKQHYRVWIMALRGGLNRNEKVISGWIEQDIAFVPSIITLIGAQTASQAKFSETTAILKP
jgi:butyrate kinase